MNERVPSAAYYLIGPGKCYPNCHMKKHRGYHEIVIHEIEYKVVQTERGKYDSHSHYELWESFLEGLSLLKSGED